DDRLEKGRDADTVRRHCKLPLRQTIVADQRSRPPGDALERVGRALRERLGGLRLALSVDEGIDSQQRYRQDREAGPGHNHVPLPLELIAWRRRPREHMRTLRFHLPFLPTERVL